MHPPATDRPALLSSIPREIAAVNDYQPYALQRLDENAREYLMQGGADEITLRENCLAFQRIRLKGRVLQAVNQGHTRLQLFGQSYSHPIFLAPLSFQRLFHPEGELATVLGASAMQATMLVSSLASISLEEIAAAATAPLWFQLYVQYDPADTLMLVRRAEACGYQALVITVDAPLAGVRNREQRIGFRMPEHVRAVNLDSLPGRIRAANSKPDVGQTSSDSLVFGRLHRPILDWAEIDRLVASSRLPVLLKGILAPEDAQRALEMGVAGIIVSNHGGRTLDTLPAAIDALRAIAAQIEGRMPILLDGGIRRGSDVFKALALGASAVCIGRPYIWGLASAGALGVAHVLRILREELEIHMMMSGCATLNDINATHLFQDVRGTN